MNRVTLAIFVLAGVIYGVRTYRAQVNPVPVFLVGQDGKKQLNPVVFDRAIKRPHGEALQRNLYTYLVVAMPESGCPGDFAELPAWIAPRNRLNDGVYDVVIIASEKLQDAIEHFAEKGPLREENMFFFSPKAPQAALGKFGMFEILYSQENGVLFVDVGNERPFSEAERLLFPDQNGKE